METVRRYRGFKSKKFIKIKTQSDLIAMTVKYMHHKDWSIITIHYNAD